jgi:hypothetical protein
VGSTVYIPSFRDIFMINIDRGTKTLKKLPPFTSVMVSSVEEISALYEFLRVHCRFRDDPSPSAIKMLCDLESQVTGQPVTNPKRFRTLAVDSLAAMGDMTMSRAIGVDEDAPLDEDVPVADWPIFRQNLHVFMRILRQMRKLPMHLLLTCPAKYTEGQDKVKRYMPDLTGQLANQVLGVVDVVGYLVALKKDKVTERQLFFDPSRQFEAKTRFNELNGIVFRDPTMSHILVRAGLIEAPAKPAVPAATTTAAAPSAAATLPDAAPAQAG